MIDILPGAINQTIDVFIQDSSSTVGAGLTGLAYNSAGLVCYYRRGATGSATAMTLATQTVGGAHSDGGLVEVSSANMPGLYRLDLSDEIVAAGVDYVTVMLKGATNMAPTVVRINLEDKVSVTDILSDGVALSTSSGVLDEVAIASTLGSQAKADVNTEVVDVLRTDSVAEVTAKPAANAALAAKLGWVFTASANDMDYDSNTGEQTIYADDGTTVIGTSTVSTASGTTTRTKFT